MEKKKPAPQSSSSSDESSSNEEEGTEQHFVRSDRKTEKIDDKKAAAAAEEEEEEDDDDDNDDEDVDGTQRGTARDNTEKASSSETHGHGDSNSTSETSSASEGKPGKPSHQFVVLPRKAENTNGHGKKAPTSEKPSKVRPAPESSPRKTKDKASKRDRDAEPQEKGSSKKQKSDKPSKTEKVSKDKSTPSHTSEKKTDAKKSVHAAAVSENPKNVPPQQNSSKKPHNASAKKAVEKSINDKKATKDSESEPLKGSVSPSKPKVFPAKDELVLTTEILRDIKQGVEIPAKKGDGYWSKLVDRVKGRMEGAWSKEQLCEKVKRMKVRYTTMAEKFKDSTERKFRNTTDKELFGLWDQIWGSGDVNEREVSEVKDKQPKVLVAASPVKGGKGSRNKVIAPIQGAKVAHEESEGPKSKHTEKQSSDDEDDSESEESDGEGDSHKKDVPVTLMEVDHKDAHADCALVPKGNAVKGPENNSQSHSFSDAQKLFQEEIRATLSELQESSKQTLKEWQSKALVVVENAVKATADQSRLMNGIGVAGFDGLFTPFRGLDLMDSEGDQALQQQWHELRLKELDVYHQKLELMLRECELKQDQLKLQLHRNK